MVKKKKKKGCFAKCSESERCIPGENAQLKLFGGRMVVLRQWLVGSIFTPGFQKQEVLIRLLVSFEMSQSEIY